MEMTFLITALTGLMLGGCTLIAFSFLLRYPKKPVLIGSYVWLGLIPYWVKKILPGMLSEWIRSVHPSEQIRTLLVSAQTKGRVEKWLLDQVNGYLSVTVPQKWPMLSMLIGEKTQDKVRQALSEYLNDNWENSVQSLCQKQVSDEQVVSMVQTMITDTKTDKLTEQVWFTVRRKIIRLSPILLSLSVLLALAGRMIFQTLSSL